MKKAGIVGAGLIGRLLALKLIKNNWQVTIFDQDIKRGNQSCGVIAGGMLSPITETEVTEHIIYELGIKSFSLWRNILNNLDHETYFQNLGSIIVSHQHDLVELKKFLFFIQKKVPSLASKLNIIKSTELSKLEPELNSSLNGIFIPFEGNIDNKQLFLNLEYTLIKNGIIWHESTKINTIDPGKITVKNLQYNFDIVFDCRGLGAKNTFKNLRGVRGELLTVHAPQVNLRHPIRIIHPKYRIYVTPKTKNIFIIGATEIESDDKSNISVKSLLELLSSAYSIHKGFAEARVEQIFTNCRPAFTDNLPKIHFEDKLIRVNGLYRHGYLLSPFLIEEIMLLINNKEPTYKSLIIYKK